MPWNYRVCRYDASGEVAFGIAEVYYDDAGSPNGYGGASVLHWDTLDDLRWTLDKMQRALSEPVLDVSIDVIDPAAAANTPAPRRPARKAAATRRTKGRT